jgi:uncharacterized protein with ParB-like and HNH nuclease domain
MASDYFTSANKSLGNLLSNDNRYSVPAYQRGYCWDRTEVEQFWEDLLQSIKEKRPFYFFGQIALKKLQSKREYEIIDGQQRLATVTILVSLIREHFDQLASKRAELIHDQYIAKRDIHTLKNEPKLTLNKEDKDFFDRYVISFDNYAGKEEAFKKEAKPPISNRLLFNSRTILKGKLAAYVGSADQEKRLLALSDALMDRFLVMETLVDDEADAFTIFETLNERGLDLTIADLLKNFLFSKAGKNLADVQRHWDNIVLHVSDSKISEFLRHYWLSSHGVVRQKMLYREMKGHLKNKDILGFTRELAKEAEIYSNLKNPTSAYWQDAEVYRWLSDLRILNVTQCLPYLLSAYVALPVSRFKKIVQLAVAMSFRYSTICNKNARNLEDLYSNIAIDIRTKKVNLVQVKAELRKLYPDDTTFKQDFAKKSITTKRVARYMLEELNQTMHRTGEERPDSVTLEHVLPENPNDLWHAHLKKNNMDYKDLVHRIGNMTLLGHEFNKKAGRELFHKKLSMYRKSTLDITKTLLEYTDWTEREIDNRQLELARLAVKYWRF